MARRTKLPSLPTAWIEKDRVNIEISGTRLSTRLDSVSGQQLLSTMRQVQKNLFIDSVGTDADEWEGVQVSLDGDGLISIVLTGHAEAEWTRQRNPRHVFISAHKHLATVQTGHKLSVHRQLQVARIVRKALDTLDEFAESVECVQYPLIEEAPWVVGYPIDASMGALVSNSSDVCIFPGQLQDSSAVVVSAYNGILDDLMRAVSTVADLGSQCELPLIIAHTPISHVELETVSHLMPQHAWVLSFDETHAQVRLQNISSGRALLGTVEWTEIGADLTPHRATGPGSDQMEVAEIELLRHALVRHIQTDQSDKPFWQGRMAEVSIQEAAEVQQQEELRQFLATSPTPLQLLTWLTERGWSPSTKI